MSKGWYRKITLLGIIVVLFFALQWSPLWRHFQGYLETITLPIISLAYRSSQWFETLWQAPKLKNENENLRQKLAYEQSLQTEISRLNLENNRLRSLAGISPATGFTALGVEIIGKQSNERNTNYLINRGSRDGLRKGMPIVIGVNKDNKNSSAVLVGTINEVADTIASWQLITSNNSKILAELMNTEKTQGVAEGEYELAIRLKYLTLGSDIVTGTKVVTSNLDPLIPPGLLIGYVTGIERTAGNFFQSALVTPEVPLDRFQFLYILQQTP